MSTLAPENEASVAVQVISVLSAGLFLSPTENISIEISIPNLGGYFRLELTDLDDSDIDDGLVRVKAAIDANARMVVTLFGDSDRDGFHTRSVSFAFETDKKTPESDFRLATLRAALSLASQTRFVAPGLGLDFWLRLNESLRDISEMLKLRQTMYRLIVIERSTGLQLRIPPFIVGQDMEAISLLYHAITERAFRWQFEGVLTVFYAASKDVAVSLDACNQSSDFVYPCFHHQSLFGLEVPLGEGTIAIIDQYMEDFEQVLRELMRDDGHTVTVKVRSKIGVAHYNFPDAPRLPDTVWNAGLQMLINMDGPLDAALMERYNALAAATLAGLDEDQKAEITARAEIGEAFLIDDESMENV